MLLLGIVIGVIITLLVAAATSLYWLKKQKYEDKLQEMGKKHTAELLVMEDRIKVLQKQNDAESKYLGSNGLLSYKNVKKNTATEE